MTQELAGVLATFIITLLLAYPLGKYISNVFSGKKTFTDFFHPLEILIYKIAGIDPSVLMNWKSFLKAMFTINMLWLAYAVLMLICQHKLPFNPDGNPAQTPDLAFNTAISFLVNCDLQHYSGESGLTYLTQLFVVTFLQFVSAATGIACLIAVFNGLREKTTQHLGNFWVIFIKTITRILMPLCIVGAIILAFNGTPSGIKGKDTIITLEGDTQIVSRGPAAAMIAIKHLGTNGGGWFGTNSAHPFENPNYFTNITEMVMQVMIPIAMIFALGFYINRRKFSTIIFAVMTVGTICLLIPAIVTEINGNPNIQKMGISQIRRHGRKRSADWSRSIGLLEYHDHYHFDGIGQFNA